METIFFDWSGRVIDEKSSDDYASYAKVYLDEEREFKIVEFIENNEVQYMEYFLGADETYKAVFESFPGFGLITFYTNKQKAEAYSKYDVLVVSADGIIKSQGIKVLGKTLLPIYSKVIDPENGKTLSFSKDHHDLQHNVHYEFEYEGNGDLSKITVYDPEIFYDTSDHTIYPHQVGLGKNPFDFDWEGFSYYRKAEPVLPDADFFAR